MTITTPDGIEKTRHVCLNGIPPVLEGMVCVPPAVNRRATVDGKVYEQYQDFYASDADLDFQTMTVEIPEDATWRVHEYIVKGELGTIGTVTQPLTMPELQAHYPHYAENFWQEATT